jgi:hypothetical protein
LVNAGFCVNEVLKRDKEKERERKRWKDGKMERVKRWKEMVRDGKIVEKVIESGKRKREREKEIKRERDKERKR